MVNDPLYEHRIKKTINDDLERVRSGKEMQAFKKCLEYKSTKTKNIDLALVNLLLVKLEQYAEGWILSNCLKTAELWNKSKALDEQGKEVFNNLKPEIDKINNMINQVIINNKSKFSPDRLQELRKLEKMYRDTNGSNKARLAFTDLSIYH